MNYCSNFLASTSRLASHRVRGSAAQHPGRGADGLAAPRTGWRAAQGLILLAVLGSVPMAQAADWQVGAGQRIASPAQIPWGSVRPGDTVSIHPGTYPAGGQGSSMTLNGVQGSAEAPIVVQAADPAQPPVLTGGVDINGSHRVRISGLAIERPLSQAFGAVLIHGGASSITLDNVEVRNSFVGVSVRDAGMDLAVRNSRIHHNTHVGIGIERSRVQGSANVRSVVANSTVYSNGGHGIDLQDAWWRIDGNRIQGNGHAYGGTSGIHLFTARQFPLDCDHNEITRNFVTDQKDSQFVDGNGILIDHYCDNNTVAGNVAWENDGAGIGIVVASGNRVVHNTLARNGRDTQRTRIVGAARADIVLHSLPTMCINTSSTGQCLGGYETIAAGRSGGNEVYDNLIAPRGGGVYGLYANDDFANPARHVNRLGPNLYVPSGDVLVRYTDSRFLRTVGEINGATGAGNAVQAVTFRDIDRPDAGVHGLQPMAVPATAGAPSPLPGLSDVRGVPMERATILFGAYHEAGQ